MTIANETISKLIKDIAILCDNCMYDDFVEKSKGIKETIDKLKDVILYEKGLEDSKILFQKETYDKIDFQKVERIGKSATIATIVGVCVMDLLCLILVIIGVNSNFCTGMAILSVFLFGGIYLRILSWKVKKLAVRNVYNGLKKSSEETKNTVEVLESLEGVLDYVHKHAVNKPKKPSSKKS